MSFNMSQYLQIFLDEGQEQIDVLEDGFLALEQEAGDELLQTLFRAAHTVKGSSRAMEFNNIGQLTHSMEDVLDDLRNRHLAISTPVVDALLRCLDYLKSMLAMVVASSSDTIEDPTELHELVELLKSIREAGEGASAAEPIATPIATTIEAPAAQSGQGPTITEGVARIDVTIEENCPMKSVRVITVLCALEPLGEIQHLEPDRAALEEERFGQTFSIWFQSEVSDEEIRGALSQLSEIAAVDILHAEGSEVAPVAPNVEPVAASPAVAALRVEEGGAKDPAQAPTVAQAAQTTQTIRVGVNRLDALLNLVGELVIDRTQIARINSQLYERFGNDDLVAQLSEATSRVARITGELQDEIMKTRMLPIDGVFQRMPRMVRDLAQKTGKQIDFQISGGETELDRSLIDAIGDPLIHLLRNSLDHGIESPEERVAAGKPPVGIVRLSASHAENYILIEVTDDGKGIDPERIKRSALAKGLITEQQAETMTDPDALRLIFASGLSTAKEVSEISGRGVGMDIVRSNLEKVGGRIDLESKVGEGSVFTIRLPLTLAIVRALLVGVEGYEYAIPLQHVVETLRLGENTDDVRREKIGSRCVMVLRGQTVPLLQLECALQGEGTAMTSQKISEDAFVVVVGVGVAKVGLCVDDLHGEQEVVIKALGNFLGEVPGVSGASILGDGRVALIVDPARLIVGAA